MSNPLARVRGATGANRAAASGRLRADRPGAFPDQYLKQCDNFMIHGEIGEDSIAAPEKVRYQPFAKNQN